MDYSIQQCVSAGEREDSRSADDYSSECTSEVGSSIQKQWYYEWDHPSTGWTRD